MNLLSVATDLTSLTNFSPLSSTGHSHGIANSAHTDGVISVNMFRQLLHPPVLGKKYIVIVPSRDHVLDYIDNSFGKESNYEFKDWLQERLINRDQVPEKYFADLIAFLIDNDVWIGDARTMAPQNNHWMIREYLSYKIDQIMFTCYERNFMLTYQSQIKTTDFFDNFLPAFVQLVDSLKLKFKLPVTQIVEQNQKFVQNQKFHGIQQVCDRYVQAAIDGSIMPNPCVTIFDEAYVQSQLRKQGWEIKVDNLNHLPNAQDLAKILYPAALKNV